MGICNSLQSQNLSVEFTVLSAYAAVCSGVLRVSLTAGQWKKGGNLVPGGRPSTILLQQRLPTAGVFCARVPVEWPVVRRGGEMRGSKYE